MFNQDIGGAAQVLFSVAPLVGVCAFGAVFAVTHRRRSSIAARLVLAGVGLMALALVISLVVVCLPGPFLEIGWPLDEIVSGFTVISFLTSGMSAAGTLLLILAAFAGRHRED